ncbi:ADP-ribosyltransferase [Nocardia sp. NPDC050193]
MYSQAVSAMRELAKKVEQNIASIGTGGSRRYRDITTVPIGQVLRKVPGADGRGADSLAGDRPAENLSPARISDRAPAPGTLRAFDSGESARRWGRSVWGATFSRLGKNRIQALRDFTVGSEGINAPLRGAARYPPDMERVERLDDILGRKPVPEWIQAWKSISAGRLFPGRDPADISPGDRGHISDFFSTALAREGIDRLKNTRNRDTDLRVEVPPGTPGIFIGDKSAWSWELELLLGRDLDFEVLEWGRAGDRWQGAIRILPPEAAV